MEYYPDSPFEAPKSPDQSGAAETSKKKKKKTTRVPLPVAKPEVTEAAEKTAEAKEPAGFEAFFTELKEKDKSPDAAETTEAVEPEATNAAEAVEPEEPEIAFANAQPPIERSEGELSEGSETIFSRPEAAEAVAAHEVADDTAGPVEAPVEPAEVPARPGQPEEPIPEVPVSETGTAHETEPAAVPMHRQMIDPNERLQAGQAATARRQAETANPITGRDVDDAYYRGLRRGISRGVASDALFGWWLVRRSKRAAERRGQMAIEHRDKEIKSLKKEQAIAAERLEAIKLTQEHMAAQLLRETTAPHTAASSEVLQPRPAASERAAFPPEKQPLRPELPPEARAITEETYQAPKGRRVETSAWHRYEVDEATGKAVEDPGVAYGEEFKKEQRQELLRKKLDEKKVAASVGSAVLFGSDGVQAQAPSAAQTAQSAGKPNSSGTKRSSPIKAILADKQYIKQQLVRRTTDPVTWVTAVVIVVLLFILGVLS